MDIYKQLEAQVLMEDNHLLAINKLPGQIVQGDKTGDIPVSELFKEYLKEKHKKPGNVFCGVIHRLDRPVSGVVILAKTSKGLSRMNEVFRDRKLEKIYWAVVRGVPEQPKLTLVNYLKKNEKDNRSFITPDGATGALRCELEYTVLKAGDRYSLLEIKPVTGRHHQIRVQLSSIGHPIAGDVKYGDKRGNEDKSICLHARQLIFTHPVNNQEITITANPPDNRYWNIFK